MSRPTATLIPSATPACPGPVRRAFALPLVVMVTLVVVVIIAAMLGRQGAQSASVAREVESVRDWHYSRGVREIIDQWLKNKAATSVKDTLAADGKAFDLVFDDNTRLRLYLADAQGTALASTAGLSGEDAMEAAGVIEQLRQAVSPRELPRYVRASGPVDVSIWTATPEVLKAVSRAVAGPENGDELARALIELRETKERLTVGDIADAGIKANLSDGRRRALSHMVAAEPSLFKFVLDVLPPTGSTPLSRYTGFLVARSGIARGSSARASPPPRSSFLSWEKVTPR